MSSNPKPGYHLTARAIHTCCFLRSALTVLVLSAIFSYAGAGGFFDKDSTELESKNTLRNIQAIKETPKVEFPLPSAYTEPPLIVEGTIRGIKEAKLYYFSRYNTVGMLASLINEQFVRTLYDNEGNPIPPVSFTIDQNPATHQLMVSCPSVEYAQQVLDFLDEVDVPPIQVRIDCIVSELYADHTLDWETTIDIQNLFGEKVTLGGKTDDSGNLLAAFPGAALRDVARSNFGANAGFVYKGDVPGHTTEALVDLLVSRGYLKILMNPTLEAVNGRQSTITMTERVPHDEIKTYDRTSIIKVVRTYVNIVDTLQVTPHVFADGYIGLKTYILIGSKITPDGVKQIPIVTKREVTITENRIKRGQSLVIGGIRKAEQRSVIRGVPFLKDIPLIGTLFSSKDFEERAKEIIFVLTPTISSGGVPNKDIIADLKRKHERIKQSDLIENIKDPLGAGAYTELVEEEAIHAELGRVKAEMEQAVAQRKSEDLIKQIAQAQRDLEYEIKQGERAAASSQTRTKDLNTEVQASKSITVEAQAQTLAVEKLVDSEKAKAAQVQTEIQQAQELAAKAAEEAATARLAADIAIAAAEKAKKDADAKIAEFMAKEKADAKTKADKPPLIKKDDAP